jgi:hypothetical protein
MKILNIAVLTVLALLIVLPVAQAQAGDFNAIINGRSVHVGATEDWNENNLGLGLEYQFASDSRWKKQLMVNGFRDSNDDMSYMAGAGLQRNLFATNSLNGLYVDAGINAFFMTRTDVNDNRPFPGVVPSLTVGNRHMGFNFTYLPVSAVERMFDLELIDDTVSGIFFVQFKVDINQLLPND